MAVIFRLHTAFFIASFTFSRPVAVSSDYSWYKLETLKSNITTTKPIFHENSATWVDTEDNLWLLGGKNISDNSSNQLNDLWMFNTTALKWYHVLSVGNTVVPYSDQSCSCGGLAFIVTQQTDTSRQKLWVYNISAHSLDFINLPQAIKNYDSFIATWCDKETGIFSLLSVTNESVTVWDYFIMSNTWESDVLVSDNTSVRLLPKSIENPKFETWSCVNGTRYIYAWSPGFPNNSFLLTISLSKVNILHVVQPSCRVSFLHWVDDRGRLVMLGGQSCNSSHFYSDQWVLNLSNLKWKSVMINSHNPSPRSGGYLWKVGATLWVYGGFTSRVHGETVILKDMWVGKPGKHVVPIQPEHNLPGDTSGLTMVDKLVISGLVLAAVMMISVRLCYKRELNQLLLNLKRRRTPYHQLSQEGDKSSRL